MDSLLDSPLFKAIQKNFYMVFLYGGAIVVTLYLTYLAWLQPDDFLAATSLGANRPMPVGFRMFMGRFILPITTLLWIFLLYVAFST
jgi:hypothetical protein